MKRLKVLICGSTFAQFYMLALEMSSDIFEFCGILAEGSARSVKCAEKYNIPFYSDIDELPQDIDIACVVVRSGVLGGNGTELSCRLLERGINVIQEQPLHKKELMECIRTAKKNKKIFCVGDLYLQLPEVKKFIYAARALAETQNITYIEASFASQVSYPAVDILLEALQNVRPFEIENVYRCNETEIINGHIGKCPMLIKIHNGVNPEDPDNYLTLLHKVAIGYDAGNLLLCDTHGPVIWNNKIHVPKEKLYFRERDGEENQDLYLKDNATQILGKYTEKSYSDLFMQDWARAILQDLLYARAAIYGRVNPDMRLQRELLCTELWSKVTAAAGYPEIVKKDIHKSIDISVLNKAAAEAEISITDSRISVLSEENTEIQRCVEYADSLLIGLDTKAVNSFEDLYENTVYLSMLYTLQIAGVLGETEKEYSLEEIINFTGTEQRFENVLERWLKLLVKHGYIKEINCRYRALTTVSKDKVYGHWNRVKEIWADKIGSQLVVDYLVNNFKALPQLLRGTQNAALLLFPEGKMNYADALYKDTITLKYLNRLAAEIVICIENIEKKQDEGFCILEVGAGVGATTEVIFKRLGTLNRLKSLNYIYTDVSRFFLSEAEKKLKGLCHMSFQELDIDKPLVDQGLKEASVDMIVAAGVLNNSRDSVEAVRELLKSLKKDSWLLIIEATREFPEILISQVFMMEEAKDARADENITFMSVSHWKEVFNTAGAKKVIVLPEDGHILDVFGQKLFMVQK